MVWGTSEEPEKVTLTPLEKRWARKRRFWTEEGLRNEWCNYFWCDAVNCNVYLLTDKYKNDRSLYSFFQNKDFSIEQNHTGQILQNLKLQSHFEANSNTGDMSKSLLTLFLCCDVRKIYIHYFPCHVNDLWTSCFGITLEVCVSY